MRYQITLQAPERHTHFYFDGSRQALAELIDTLENADVRLQLSTQTPNFIEHLPLLLALEEENCAALDHSHLGPLLVWDRKDLAAIREVAYAHGALCVLPPNMVPPALLQALANAQALISSSKTQIQGPAVHTRRRYRKGEQVRLAEDRVVQVVRGIVRCTSVHPDGSEVLIGFYGEKDILMPHHAHTCYVEMTAHTSLLVEVESWSTAATSPEFYSRLKERICQMESWSSMQARASIESRLLGIIQVLSHKFGIPHPRGTLLEIKLTHDLLASAIGANRTTVTRIIGNLKRQGDIAVEKTQQHGELILLPGYQLHRH